MRPMRRFFGSLPLAMLVWLVAAPAAPAQELKRGEEFPRFVETDLRTGKEIDLKSFRGKVVLVDFWATWCSPCRSELPNVKKMYEKYHKQGFEIISISLDTNLDTCKKYIEEQKLDWYHIGDGKGWGAKLAKKHKVPGIPCAVLVGKDGKILHTSARGAALEQYLKEGLKAEYTPEKVVDDEIEIAAKKKLAEADELRVQGQWGAALKLYEEIGVEYAARDTGKLANLRARRIREDPELMKLIEQSESVALERKAEKEVGRDLEMARKMRDLKKYDLARKYYQKVIEKYPDTEVGQQAKKELDKLPS